MNEILDYEEKVQQRTYIKRSIYVYVVCACMLVGMALAITLRAQTLYIGAFALAPAIISPVGLFFCVKSLQRDTGTRAAAIIHIIGYLSIIVGTILLLTVA